jgi:hypothetical protein
MGVCVNLGTSSDPMLCVNYSVGLTFECGFGSMHFKIYESNEFCTYFL